MTVLLPSEREALMTDRIPTAPVAAWTRYNPLTCSYETPDGTSVAEEVADNANCLVDVLHIATIRDKQRTHGIKEEE